MNADPLRAPETDEEPWSVTEPVTGTRYGWLPVLILVAVTVAAALWRFTR